MPGLVSAYLWFCVLQDLVQRIQNWETAGKLLGVLDKTKYLVLTMDELSRISSIISERGRIAMPELAAVVNEIVRIDGP